MSVNQNLPNLSIGYARGRLLKFFGIGLLATLMCTAVAFNWYRGKDINAFQMTACYVGVALFGFATCKTLWLLISSREPVVFISRGGIRDTRIADEIIAWQSVRDILIWQYRGQKIVVLKLDPLLARRFAGGFLKGLLSLMNKALGADGVVVTASGLTIDSQTLFDTCRQYWTAGRFAYSSRSVPEPESVS
jgi:hypothetical protein